MAPRKPKPDAPTPKVKVQVGYSRPAPGALLKKGRKA
jgi:hypothetical protein